MSDDFDLAYAERVLVSALAARTGADRLSQFGTVTSTLDGALREVRRLAKSNAAMLSEAVQQLSATVIEDLAREIAKCGTVMGAVEEFLSKNFHCPRGLDGRHRWEVRPDSDLHEPIENLKRVMAQVQRSTP